MFARLARRFLPLTFIFLGSTLLSPWTDMAEARGRAVHVHGYFRKDGTYVQPHYRSAPDGTFQNNWSTRGNVNPYTGEPGTKDAPPARYGQDVYVEGYTRSDGTYVPPHYRSAPDGDPSNDWSTEGKINPYTGEAGRRSLVYAIQQSLIRAGENPGPADGILKPQTAAAFQSFALKHGGGNEPVEVTMAKLKAFVDERSHSETPAITPTDDAMVRSHSRAEEGAAPRFTTGSTAIQVLDAQGQPDLVKSGEWFYGRSWVLFQAGRVVRWTQVDTPLHAR